MNDKFLITKNIKEFIMSLDPIIYNFPKKDIVLKDRIYSDSYDLLYLVYLANEKKNKELMTQAISKISMIDFYLERSYKNKYISEKQCRKYSNRLLLITKLIYGWMKSERI